MCQSTLVSIAVIVIAASLIISFIAAATTVAWVFVCEARKRSRTKRALASYKRSGR